MSTVFSSWQKLLSMSPVVGTRISLDLGSSNTRIMVGDKLVYHQPSCLLWHPASETVADIGTKALQAVDKLPPAVQVLFPVRSGEITDTKVAELYLKSVLTKVLARPKAWPIIIGLRSMIGVPAGQTPVEKNILKTVLANVGLGSSTYFSKTQAINTVLLRQAHIRDHVCRLYDHLDWWQHLYPGNIGRAKGGGTLPNWVVYGRENKTSVSGELDFHAS